MNRVFVYGSLKRQQANHHWLDGARFVGRARLRGAQLYSLGAYPMAVLRDHTSHVIHGEVFEVDAAGLDRLDQLEGYPGYYDRQVLALSDGTSAWVYLGNDDHVKGCSLVAFGDWASTPVFSYGSNMDPAQLQQRCQDWDGTGLVVRLEGWRWGITKRADGRDGEGYAGIQPDSGAHCWGVVHHISGRDRRILDLREGVGIHHYRHEQLMVTTSEGETFAALAYVPEPEYLADELLASSHYRQRILNGAAHWGLGSDWCNVLRESLLMTA